MRTYVQSSGRHRAALISAFLFMLAVVAFAPLFGLGRQPGLVSDLDGAFPAGGLAAVVPGLGWLVRARVLQRRQMLDEQADDEDAFSSLDAAPHDVSAGENPDQADGDHQAEQNYPQRPEPTAAQQVAIADGYIGEMQDVLRRLNIQAPVKRRWFLWGVRTRFEVGLRLMRPRLSNELLAVHLDAFDAAAKTIEREDLRRQQGIGHRA